MAGSHCFFSLALCLLTSMHWGPTCVPSTVLGAVRNGSVFWAEIWCAGVYNMVTENAVVLGKRSLQAVIKEIWYEGELQSVFQLWGECYPYSQEPRNTTKSATQQEVGKEEPRRVPASAMARNSKNWAGGRAYIEFLGDGVEWSFPRWALVGFHVQSLGFLLCRAGAGSKL